MIRDDLTNTLSFNGGKSPTVKTGESLISIVALVSFTLRCDKELSVIKKL